MDIKVSTKDSMVHSSLRGSARLSLQRQPASLLSFSGVDNQASMPMHHPKAARPMGVQRGITPPLVKGFL